MFAIFLLMLAFIVLPGGEKTASAQAVRIVSPDIRFPLETESGVDYHLLRHGVPVTLEVQAEGRLALRVVPLLRPNGVPGEWRLGVVTGDLAKRVDVPVRMAPGGATTSVTGQVLLQGLPEDFALGITGPSRVDIALETIGAAAALAWSFTPGDGSPEESSLAVGGTSAPIRRPYAGLSAGYRQGFGDVSGPTVRLHAGYRFPVLDDGLAFEFGLEWYRGGNDERLDLDEVGRADVDWNLHAIPFTFDVRYMLEAGRLVFGAGAGLELTVLSFRNEVQPLLTAPFREDETTVSFGPRFGATLGWQLGTGHLRADAAWANPDLGNDFDFYTGTLSGIGYRLGYDYFF